ncbi:hypothetical protein M5K25_014618 [Dendrobium thyrsiflorum]|uniref:Uncharacterized protein n=1 Tax=Dendrobium thyrsiflorum TaxID=117978 RepID=A0ABD0UNY9_DENTH
MSPDQGFEVLLEGSNRNSDYEPHFTLKRDPRLKESKETQDRSYPLCSSSTTAGPPVEGPTLRRTTSRRPYTSPDHRLKALHSAGPPPKRLYSSPDHHLKALQSAGPPPQGPTFCLRPDVLPKALRPTQGPKLCSRPDILPKARCSA